MPRSERLASLDAYRGLIMLTLAAAAFGLAKTSQQFPDSKAWRYIEFHFEHTEWVSQKWVAGVSYWDLIQPSFMFMVGVSMPFSYSKRAERGDKYWKLLLHALIRSVVLVLLGVFLASAWDKRTDWIFTNVLAQIGLGYVFVFLLLKRETWEQLLVAGVVLFSYWFLFVVYPVDGATRLADHFQIHTNFAAHFDVLLLNLFPRATPFDQNKGGYTTLNFVPSMVTMLFGLMAGELLRSERSPREKVLRLVGAGAICLGLGIAAGYTICPVVKRIWTPSWTLFSGGYVLWILAAFYLVVDVIGWRGWTYPLQVFGTNSILVYFMGQLLRGWTADQLRIHLGSNIFRRVADWAQRMINYSLVSFDAMLHPGDYSPIVQSLMVLLVFWLICWWLYRQKLFVRI